MTHNNRERSRGATVGISSKQIKSIINELNKELSKMDQRKIILENTKENLVKLLPYKSKQENESNGQWREGNSRRMKEKHAETREKRITQLVNALKDSNLSFKELVIKSNVPISTARRLVQKHPFFKQNEKDEWCLSDNR